MVNGAGRRPAWCSRSARPTPAVPTPGASPGRAPAAPPVRSPRCHAGELRGGRRAAEACDHGDDLRRRAGVHAQWRPAAGRRGGGPDGARDAERPAVDADGARGARRGRRGRPARAAAACGGSSSAAACAWRPVPRRRPRPAASGLAAREATVPYPRRTAACRSRASSGAERSESGARRRQPALRRGGRRPGAGVGDPMPSASDVTPSRATARTAHAEPAVPRSLPRSPPYLRGPKRPASSRRGDAAGRRDSPSGEVDAWGLPGAWRPGETPAVSR